MLIKDIEPIDKVGVNLLEEENAENIIDEIIELPLRKACRVLKEKGIETVMSSANKSNVLKIKEKPIEKEDIYGNGQQYMSPRPTFVEMGKGYAWIMINFDTLSDDNKDLLFQLEEKKNKDGDKVGEKAIWFVHPFEMGNIDFDIKIGKYDYEYLKQILPEDQMPEKIEVDLRLAEFEKRHVVVGYNATRYPVDTVVLRMPVNENTSVEEVEEYFEKFARIFKNQSKNRENNKKEEQNDR